MILSITQSGEAAINSGKGDEVIEFEKRGISIVDEADLNHEKVAAQLWKKLDRVDQIMSPGHGLEEIELPEKIQEAIESETDFIPVPQLLALMNSEKQTKQYHIVGLSAQGLNDSRKKWQVNKVIMGCNCLMTS